MPTPSDPSGGRRGRRPHDSSRAPSVPAASAAGTERIVTSALLQGGGARGHARCRRQVRTSRGSTYRPTSRTSTSPPGRTTGPACCTATCSSSTTTARSSRSGRPSRRPTAAATACSGCATARRTCTAARGRPTTPGSCASNDGGIISFRASDGGGARRLTTNPYGGQDLPIGYSPDGTPAGVGARGPAIPPTRLERAAIFVADADGTHARRLNALGTAAAPTSSRRPTGPRTGRQFVAATREGRLVTVDAVAGGATPLPVDLGSNAFAVMPDYSPDGLRIVFAMFRDRPATSASWASTAPGLRRITHTGNRSELSP